MNDDELDRIFKALGDPFRRRIVDRLRERPALSLFEICSLSVVENGVSISRQAISQHLDLLERAGLVRVTWSGRTKIHFLDPRPLHDAFNQWLRGHLRDGESG